MKTDDMSRNNFEGSILNDQILSRKYQMPVNRIDSFWQKTDRKGKHQNILVIKSD
jgi:hypothetical protein